MSLAARFAAAVEDVILKLREQPHAHAKAHGEIRRAFVRPFRHAVYFRVSPTEVVVLGVVHASRDPRAWKTRR